MKRLRLDARGSKCPKPRDGMRIPSLLWVSYTAATAAAAAKVFLLDSCPRLQTPSVSQRNYGRNWIFSGCYWILFITFAELSRASLLLYLLL